jgi:Mn2+/Fe2+ NRAMP family transporter
MPVTKSGDCSFALLRAGRPRRAHLQAPLPRTLRFHRDARHRQRQLGRVARATLLPHLSLNSTNLALLVAILGTTISPYLFFWQNLHRLEEMRDEAEGGNKPKPLNEPEKVAAGKKQRRSRFDVFSGMAFSNVVMFSIIVATAWSNASNGCVP